MAALAFVIRPVLIGLCLVPARLGRGERAFVLFAGLKGAVPILLGSFLLAASVPGAQWLYGRHHRRGRHVLRRRHRPASCPPPPGCCACRCAPIEPEPWALGVRLRDEPAGVHQLTVTAGSPADGRTVDEVDEIARLPGQAWVSFIVRDGQLVPVNAGTRLRPGDDVLVLADPGVKRQSDQVLHGIHCAATPRPREPGCQPCCSAPPTASAP